MNALDEQLARAFDDEPPVGDAVGLVFRRAEQLRKRRIRRLLLIGLSAVVLVAGLGYGLTSALLPTAAGPAEAPAQSAAAAEAPAQSAAGAEAPAQSAAGAAAGAADRAVTATDPAGPALAEISGLRLLPRLPGAGPGWRRYSAVDAAGRSRGMVEIAVFWKPDGLCLPVLTGRGACALPQHTGGLEYTRYGWDSDVNWQLNEVIARRLTDGRTLAVLATGERNTDDAQAGRPPLTGRQTAAAATDPRVLAAFDAAESCDDPAVSCPAMRVKVPAGR